MAPPKDPGKGPNPPARSSSRLAEARQAQQAQAPAARARAQVEVNQQPDSVASPQSETRPAQAPAQARRPSPWAESSQSFERRQARGGLRSHPIESHRPPRQSKDLDPREITRLRVDGVN
eukprot:1143654-Pelagomonas_calceolata.AAC.2